MKALAAAFVLGLTLIEFTSATPIGAAARSTLNEACEKNSAISTSPEKSVSLLKSEISASPTTDILNIFYSLFNESLRNNSAELADCRFLLAQELEKRGVANRRIKKNAIDGILRSGQFNRARQAAITWNLFSKRDWITFEIATPQKLEQASYFELSQDGATAHQKYINLKQGTYVITYFEPGCSFCEKAKRDIGKDAKLSTIFRKNSIWINSPSIGTSRQDYLAWMKPNSPTPGRFVIDTIYWPERDILGVPYFFFIKDGVIIASHLGWHKDSKEKIFKHLNELGLMPATGQ